MLWQVLLAFARITKAIHCKQAIKLPNMKSEIFSVDYAAAK
jgi:hypothetical protein